jgi:hypothetical protein
VRWLLLVNTQEASSLGIRLRDIATVRAGNGPWLLIFGGDVTEAYYMADRSRWVPITSNVQAFEVMWKFGLGGLVIPAAWCVFVLWRTPYGWVWRHEGAGAPASSCLLALPAMAQCNNVIGMPWAWVLVALLIVVNMRTRRRLLCRLLTFTVSGSSSHSASGLAS